MPNAVVLKKKAKGIYFFPYLLMSLHGHNYSFCFFVFSHTLWPSFLSPLAPSLSSAYSFAQPDIAINSFASFSFS